MQFYYSEGCTRFIAGLYFRVVFMKTVDVCLPKENFSEANCYLSANIHNVP